MARIPKGTTYAPSAALAQRQTFTGKVLSRTCSTLWAYLAWRYWRIVVIAAKAGIHFYGGDVDPRSRGGDVQGQTRGKTWRNFKYFWLAFYLGVASSNEC